MNKETLIKDCENWVNNHKGENFLLTYPSIVELLAVLKEQEVEIKGFAMVKEPDCRICAQNSCRYYHESRKPTECKSYMRSNWVPKFSQED